MGSRLYQYVRCNLLDTIRSGAKETPPARMPGVSGLIAWSAVEVLVGLRGLLLGLLAGGLLVVLGPAVRPVARTGLGQAERLVRAHERVHEVLVVRVGAGVERRLGAVGPTAGVLATGHCRSSSDHW